MSERSHPLPLDLSAIWPEGLKALLFTTGFSRTDLDQSDIQEALEKRGLVYRQRGTELLLPLIGRGVFAGYWGRVEMLPTRDDLARIGEATLQFSIFREEGEQSIAPPDSLSLDEFPDLLKDLAKPNFWNRPTIVSGEILLPTHAWRPAVTLPVQLPGVLDSASGSPEITGLEFMFREPSSELKRAEISLSLDDREFSVKLMILISSSPLESLAQRACHLLGQHLGLFAVRVKPAEAPEHV